MTDADLGDSYTLVGLDADSKLILAHHVGRRTAPHTAAFVEELDRATGGRFQLTTDGFNAYPDAIAYHLGTRTDYATLVKELGTESEEERRYSPPRMIAATKTVIHGEPDSKVWRNHRAAVALTVAHYNLCTMHRTIRTTPAMKAGLVNRPWSVAELLAA